MDTLINIVKIILLPIFSLILTIKKAFLAFGNKWENAENMEDKVAISVLYTLFLIVLGLSPLLFLIVLKSIGWVIIFIILATLSTIAFLVSGWVWILDGY